MPKNENPLKVLSILLLAILACGRTSGLTPTVSQPLSSGESSHCIDHDNISRSYILYTPASMDWSKPVPVVLVFHGGTGNAELYSIIGGGHAWPEGQKARAGSDLPTNTITASQVIWEFFDAHPMP